MAIERIEIDLLKLPYVHFFETSFGRAYDRTFSLVKVCEDGIYGWGECVAEEAPLYSGETTETAWHVMKEFLVPLIFRKGLIEPEDYAREAAVFRGNRMAKAGIELALWDLKAKKAGLPLHKLYGGIRTEIAAGVSCGIEDSVPELVARIGQYLDQGYKRIKIKIKPGWDAAACAVVLEKYPDIMLQADANGAYGLKDMEALKALDAYGLLMIEQPFAPYDLWDHAKLQREMKTPLCLDESILSFDTARAALEMGSCRVVNIKVGRVGGGVETRLDGFAARLLRAAGIALGRAARTCRRTRVLARHGVLALRGIARLPLAQRGVQLSLGGVVGCAQAAHTVYFPGGAGFAQFAR